MASVSLPEGLRRIYECTFEGCTSLTSITIPSGITAIDADAFYGCKNLTSATIPSSDIEFGDCVFSYCQLLRFNVDADNPYFMTDEADIFLYDKNMTTVISCPGVTGDVVLPDSLLAIRPWTFKGCSDMTSITIPSGVATIGESAFSECSGLMAVKFCGKPPVSIGTGAFPWINGYYPYKYRTDWMEVLDKDWAWNHLTMTMYSDSANDPLVEVFFDANGGVVNRESFVFASGEMYEMLPSPSKDGHRFLGWWTALNGGTQVTATDAASDNVTTIYAHWEEISLNKALDNDALQFTTGGDAEWFGTDIDTHDGEDAARSDALSYGRSAWIETTIVDTGTISFWWKVSAAYANRLEFFVDGELVEDIYNKSSWTTATFTIEEEGIHVLRWNYYRNGYSPADPECRGWLDQIVWTPTPKVEVLLDANGGKVAQSVMALVPGKIYGTLPTPERYGYAFVGWWTSLTGGEQITESSIVGNDAIKLYAHWRQLPSLTYDVFNGEVMIIGFSEYYDGSTVIEIPSTIDGFPVISIGDFAFNNCSDLTHVTIPDGVTDIGASAFAGCAELRSINLPDTLSVIGDDAFDGCVSLTSITIPATVGSIADNAFDDCAGLTEIVVAPGNSDYCSVDGILFSYDKTMLLKCPEAKQGAYVIPNGVVEINECAFASCIGLTSITLPEGLETIGIEAFYNCQALVNMEIPESVVTIDELAFSACSSLEGISFKGVAPEMIGDGAFPATKGYYPSNRETAWLAVLNDETIWNNLTMSMYANGVDKENPVNVALDNEELAFVFGGAAEWTVQTSETKDGTDALQSGRIADEQSSWVETTVTGKGTISFWWKVSSESDYDELVFLVDGVSIDKNISGVGLPWAQVEHPITTPGVHTLRWSYVKDISSEDGDDCAWLDCVVWKPAKITAATVGGVEYETVADAVGAAVSTNTIEVAEGKVVATRVVNGVVTLEIDGVTVEGVAEYYTPKVEGQKVTLGLNEKAKPVFGEAPITDENNETVTKPAIEVAEDGTFKLTVKATYPTLWYRLMSTKSLNPVNWRVEKTIQGKGQAERLSSNPANGGRFFKVEVFDYNPQ